MTEIERDENGFIIPALRKPLIALGPYDKINSPEDASLRVVVLNRTLQSIEKHLSSDKKNELAGVLVGEACTWENRLYIEILAHLPAQTTSHSPVHFTYTIDSWIALTEDLENKFPDLYIVGWYHSHPGLGSFFSGQDINVHNTVFYRPFHVALVIDPIRHEQKFFGWEAKQIIQLPGFYLIDETTENKQEELQTEHEIKPSELCSRSDKIENSKKFDKTRTSQNHISNKNTAVSRSLFRKIIRFLRRHHLLWINRGKG